jgi:hypothetical protein
MFSGEPEFRLTAERLKEQIKPIHSSKNKEVHLEVKIQSCHQALLQTNSFLAWECLICLPMYANL